MNLQTRVRKATTSLLFRYPFFGFLVQRMRIVVDESVPTASVSPKGLLQVNPEFVSSLTDPQLVGLLCHEVLHPAMNYWGRRGSRNELLLSNGEPIPAWNVAHDFEINAVIQEAAEQLEGFIELPPGGAFKREWVGRSAEQIYDDILASAPTLNLGSFVPDVTEGEEQDEENRCVWREHLRGAVEAQRFRGMGTPKSLSGFIKETLDPKVSWKTVLARWVGDNLGDPWYHYHKPSRRSEATNGYLPTQDLRNAPEVIVLWDTSGSMEGEEKKVLSEVLAVMESRRSDIRLIMCDTKIHLDVLLSWDNIEEASRVRGGGGSDFRPGFEEIQEPSSSVVIAITDGYIDVPAYAPQVQAVLWLLTAEGRDPTQGAWGQALRMVL